VVFIIGALALAGLPIFNGFWSKELILEAGLAGGPPWAFYGMLLVAGITAFYTCRCVTMVFFNKGQSQRHLHDAPLAMRIALIPLGIGTLVTWLLAGSFGTLLKDTLPLHEIEVESTLSLVKDILTAPVTALALGVIALGLAAWKWRARLGWFKGGVDRLSRAAETGFGFEAINHSVVSAVQRGAEVLRGTQTGVLGWNIAGIVLGLVVILLLLWIGV
jgi:NADH-quinone oxidoreductase subunit L